MNPLSFFRSAFFATMLFSLLTACVKNDEPGEGEPPPPPPPPAGTPVLSTTSVSGITQTTAATGGNITSDGGAAVTARGVCWGTATAPVIAGNKTTDGSGSGNFSSSITGLVAGTTYYVRAYATNSAGTAYGNEHSFTTNSAPAASVTDIDGNVYETIQIGNQVWTKQNLRVTKYNDGTPIKEVQVGAAADSSWLSIYGGAWCHYNNVSANDAVYGKLYNWFAVNTGKLAPAGWHVPTEAEWLTLLENLGGYVVAGGKMKSTTSHWTSPNVGADNSSGFTGLPGGGRGGSNTTLGQFGAINTAGVFWSSTLKEGGSAWCYVLSNGSAQVSAVYDAIRSGCSVRLIKN